MAINYEEVGWSADKFVNPSNMGHMDDGIKAACDEVDRLSSKNPFYADSASGISEYPANCGVYIITNKIAGLPNEAAPYGTLFIYGRGYFTHIYQDMNSNIYAGRNSGTNIVAPSTWKKVTMS